VSFREPTEFALSTDMAGFRFQTWRENLLHGQIRKAARAIFSGGHRIWRLSGDYRKSLRDRRGIAVTADVKPNTKERPAVPAWNFGNHSDFTARQIRVAGGCQLDT
jgi:hypothetical protein